MEYSQEDEPEGDDKGGNVEDNGGGQELDTGHAVSVKREVCVWKHPPYPPK